MMHWTKGQLLSLSVFRLFSYHQLSRAFFFFFTIFIFLRPIAIETWEGKAWISVTVLLSKPKTTVDIAVSLDRSPNPSHSSSQSQISRTRSDELSLDMYSRKQKSLVGDNLWCSILSVSASVQLSFCPGRGLWKCQTKPAGEFIYHSIIYLLFSWLKAQGSVSLSKAGWQFPALQESTNREAVPSVISMLVMKSSVVSPL